MDQHKKKRQLKELNEHITCRICHGYLIDATTVTECMHTFCKSCIVKHLENSSVCPKCRKVIHPTNPLDHISYDSTLQDLVFRIVPGLSANEYERKRKFHVERGLPLPAEFSTIQERSEKHSTEEEITLNRSAKSIDRNFYSQEEDISIQLIYKSRV